MGETTKIQWAHHTFNPWRGCTKVSAGCANCYAEALSDRNPRVFGRWGNDGERVVASTAMWREPAKWDRQAAADSERRRVFCASLADVFETFETMRIGLYSTVRNARVRLFETIERTPALDWLLLTKRPQHVVQLVDEVYRECRVMPNPWPLPNVWLGTSVEDQAAADARIPHLIDTPATIRFLSCEPLLGPVDLNRITKRLSRGGIVCGTALGSDGRHFTPGGAAGTGVDWVIVGGESGRDARLCDVDWIRTIIRDCQAAGVPVFVKQLGSRPTTRLPDFERWPGHRGPTSPVQFHGDGFGNYEVTGLKDPKGGDPSEWPEDLRVREVPAPLRSASA